MTWNVLPIRYIPHHWKSGLAWPAKGDTTSSASPGCISRSQEGNIKILKKRWIINPSSTLPALTAWSLNCPLSALFVWDFEQRGTGYDLHFTKVYSGSLMRTDCKETTMKAGRRDRGRGRFQAGYDEIWSRWKRKMRSTLTIWHYGWYDLCTWANRKDKLPSTAMCVKLSCLFQFI